MNWFMIKIILLILIPISIFSQNNYILVQEMIDELLFQLPDNTRASIFIYNPDLDDTIYTKNENIALIPASNIKLFTTAAALHFLGPENNLSTLLLSDDSDFSDSTINGNLYLKGYGNSLFTISDFCKRSSINT